MQALGIAILTAIAPVVSSQSEATLLFAGDAMQHQKQIDVARRSDGTYNYDACFARIAPLISAADYAVVNLETPIAGAPYSGYPMFNTPDTYLDALSAAGFDMFLTANNHTLDRRDRGLRATVSALDARGLDHIGTYSDIAERDSVLPFIKDINGFSVGFLNYTYGTNGIDIQGDVVVDYIDTSKMHADIERTRQAGAEIVCVAIHWGDEYKLLPNYHQRRLADYLVDEGVDMVIGGHPHVIQPMEIRTDTCGRRQLVVYSLGNFISNMTTRDTRGGAIVQVRLKRDEHGRAYVDTADYDLVFTIPGSVGADNFHLVFTDSIRDSRWVPACRAFTKAATDIFDAHNREVPKRKQ